MRKVVTILILIMTWISSCGQGNTSRTAEVTTTPDVKSSAKNNTKKSQQDYDLERYIYTDTTYASTNGKGITIQNSFPKGGMIKPDGTQYFDWSGRRYGFATFWTRIINETNTPLELDINIPTNQFAIFTQPDAFLRLLLPKETFSLDKLSKFNYGLTEIKSYLDANLHKSSSKQTTINPNEELAFYLIMLTYQAAGTSRAELTLEGQDLYYTTSVTPHGSGTIPVGKITFKE